jgi:hypothetical protein
VAEFLAFGLTITSETCWRGHDEEMDGSRIEKIVDSSSKEFGFGGVEGQRTERTRRVDALTRYAARSSEMGIVLNQGAAAAEKVGSCGGVGRAAPR